MKREAGQTSASDGMDRRMSGFNSADFDLLM